MRYAQLPILLLVFSTPVYSEKGILNLFVSDLNGHPLGRRHGVHIKVKDPGNAAYPDDNGTLPLPLGPDIAPGDDVELVLLEPDNLFMVSPWDSRVIVPSFQSKGRSFVDVLLAAKGSLDALRNAKVREAIAARIGRDRAPHTVDDQSSHPEAANLAREAQATGYTPEQLDGALRDWAKTVQSPRQKAIAALFLGDFKTAVQQSQAALGSRETGSPGQGLFDMSLFLAQALFEMGDYTRAADQAKIAVGLRPRDERALNLWGICLAKAGKDDTAIAALRSAAAIEKQLSSSAAATFNVAEELYRKGELGAAEALYLQVQQDQSKLTAPDKELVDRTKTRLEAIGKVRSSTTTGGASQTSGTKMFWVPAIGVIVLAALIAVWTWLRRSRARPVYRQREMRDFGYRYEAPMELPRSAPRQAHKWTVGVPIAVAALVIVFAIGVFKAPRKSEPQNQPTPSATGPTGVARSYTVKVQMVDPEGRDTKTVNCWSSVSGDRVRSGDIWTFRFLLAGDAKVEKAEFFADDAEGNRSGRVVVTLASNFEPNVTMRLAHQREPVFSGTVVDGSEAPIPNAIVNVLGSRKSAISSADGGFSFPPDEITTKSLTLSISAPGYSRTVVPRVSDQTNVRVSLSQL